MTSAAVVARQRPRGDDGKVFGTVSTAAVDEFGARLREAAAILRTVADINVVGVELGGWDHHANQVVPGNPAFGIHQQLLATLGAGLRAF